MVEQVIHLVLHYQVRVYLDRVMTVALMDRLKMMNLVEVVVELEVLVELARGVAASVMVSVVLVVLV